MNRRQSTVGNNSTQKPLATSGSPMGSRKSVFSMRKMSTKKRNDNDGDSPRSATDAAAVDAAVAALSKLKTQFEQLQRRLESEGKKVAENTAKIEQLEALLASIDEQNTTEIGEHEIAVSVEAEKLESIQEQLNEALRRRDEISNAVSEIVDGDTIKKVSNNLRIEQLVNFVLTSTSKDMMITADDIDRDVTGERVRALAHYEEGDHAGKELRITFQRRRELWENYEHLWLRESDSVLKPKFSNEETSYYRMLEPHRCRWNTCVLDRCATEYMQTKHTTWMAFAQPERRETTTIGGALAVAKAAKLFRGSRPSTKDGSAATPTAGSVHFGTPSGVAFGGADPEEKYFPHRCRLS